MPEGFYDDNIIPHLRKFIGETVTIFTTSGGESGRGFTGVLLSVNNCFVRLVTQIGPAPGCALGNACDGYNNRRRSGYGPYNNIGGYNTGCFRNDYINNLGSVTDIPVDRIASFVHNAI